MGHPAMTLSLSRATGPVWIAGLCAASLLSILFVDRPAATWVHAAAHGGAVFVALTHIVDPILPLAAIGFLVAGAAIRFGWRPGPAGHTLLCACVAVLVAVAVKDQAKYAFGRLWPETWVNDNPSWIGTGAYGFAPFHGGAGWASFPSGHMTVVTAPMAVVWFKARRWRPVACLPVVLVAVGLFGANYHFVGDMLAGTLLGTVCAACVLAIPVTWRPSRAGPS